jgi:hypothetical protein
VLSMTVEITGDIADLDVLHDLFSVLFTTLSP